MNCVWVIGTRHELRIGGSQELLSGPAMLVTVGDKAGCSCYCDNEYELHVERTVRVDDHFENVLWEHFIDQALLEELA